MCNPLWAANSTSCSSGSRKNSTVKRPGLLVGVFTVLIASGRFLVEFFREPDAQLTEFAARTGLHMGQWLSLPLVLAGLGLVLWALRRPELASGYKPAEA